MIVDIVVILNKTQCLVMYAINDNIERPTTQNIHATEFINVLALGPTVSNAEKK